jgi:hypothetical protein
MAGKKQRRGNMANHGNPPIYPGWIFAKSLTESLDEPFENKKWPLV